jgi:hypothetical protein
MVHGDWVMVITDALGLSAPPTRVLKSKTFPAQALHQQKPEKHTTIVDLLGKMLLPGNPAIPGRLVPWEFPALGIELVGRTSGQDASREYRRYLPARCPCRPTTCPLANALVAHRQQGPTTVADSTARPRFPKHRSNRRESVLACVRHAWGYIGGNCGNGAKN